MLESKEEEKLSRYHRHKSDNSAYISFV